MSSITFYGQNKSSNETQHRNVRGSICSTNRLHIPCHKCNKITFYANTIDIVCCTHVLVSMLAQLCALLQSYLKFLIEYVISNFFFILREIHGQFKNFDHNDALKKMTFWPDTTRPIKTRHAFLGYIYRKNFTPFCVKLTENFGFFCRKMLKKLAEIIFGQFS